jgi:catechol 2,3-dioxygenase-like lactoylglutathione lyase family enzyme
MAISITSLTLVVRDYDEALDFFINSLRFKVIEDTPMENGKRWVLVAPSGSKGASLLLARADSPEQQNRIGDQTGGRVSLFLQTEDFWNDYQHMKFNGVQFAEQPRQETYGTVVVFLDLYGNKWDLIQPSEGSAEDQKPD